MNGGKNVFPEDKRGTINSDLFVMADWLPTILQGIVKNERILPRNLDGRNIIPSLFGDKEWDRQTVILDSNFDGVQIEAGSLVQAAVIHDNWKYIHGEQLYDCYYPAKPKPKICLNETVNDRYLFNLKDDPHEGKNLIAEHPEKVAYLISLIVDDARDNGWQFNYLNVQWNSACAVHHNGTWTTWLEDAPQNDFPMECQKIDGLL